MVRLGKIGPILLASALLFLIISFTTEFKAMLVSSTGSSVTGSPTTGPQTAGSSVTGSPVSGSPTPGTPVTGSPTAVPQTAGSPVTSSPTAGPQTASAPVTGSPTPGSPVAGSPATGASRGSRALAADTVFYTPKPITGPQDQFASLTSSGSKADAGLIRSMVDTPQAVWETGGEPKAVLQDVQNNVSRAAEKGAIPVFVAYNVPGRDCSQYSAGGAASGDAYKAWIDAFADGLGSQKAVVIVEPDGLSLLPSDCGQPDTYDRAGLIKYAAQALMRDPNALVYLDAGHSAWHSIGDIAQRLVKAGVGDASGFFLNVSNYQYTPNSVEYGNWISACIAYTGKVKPGDYSGCPNQYWNGGPATNWQGTAMNPYGEWSDSAASPEFNTSGTNSRYASLLGDVKPTVHFVIDTSRNGQGPWQPPTGHSTGDGQDWCNPPDRGLGYLPTAATGQPLVDAYLWVKIPGASDGQCSRWAGGATDPVRAMQDPAAGEWFPQMALELVHNAKLLVK